MCNKNAKECCHKYERRRVRSMSAVQHARRSSLIAVCRHHPQTHPAQLGEIKNLLRFSTTVNPCLPAVNFFAVCIKTPSSNATPGSFCFLPPSSLPKATKYRSSLKLPFFLDKFALRVMRKIYENENRKFMKTFLPSCGWGKLITAIITLLLLSEWSPSSDAWGAKGKASEEMLINGKRHILPLHLREPLNAMEKLRWRIMLIKFVRTNIRKSSGEVEADGFSSFCQGISTKQ